MSTLHVRSVPSTLYEALRRVAKDRGSSISAETVRLLGEALKVDRSGVRELIREIEGDRPRARRGAPSAAELIRQDRDSR